MADYFNVTFDDKGMAMPFDQTRIRKFEMDVTNDPKLSDYEKVNMLDSFYARNNLVPGSFQRNGAITWESSKTPGYKSSIAGYVFVIVIGVLFIADVILRKLGVKLSLLKIVNDLFWDGVGLLMYLGQNIIRWLIN